MNVGELKKVLWGLKNDTPIKIITEGIRPCGYNGGEGFNIVEATPFNNQGLHLYTDSPTKTIEKNSTFSEKKIPREGWAEQMRKVEENKDFEYYMSLPYKMVIFPASEGGYVAEIPELPGCLTQGDNWQDIFEMIQDAKAAWIDIALEDGKVIPEPEDEYK
ncbi:type II toxin-antitoxin system HicB family antitoxin [Pelosinus sp. IPA-1]|uniref:type II toxin-antitoxin system HicB family antitoxin n=1 Tax=Pelosinus sp. IPA-1 TaxID=3029569 RepID=UPI0024361B8C|nr:type II toxin-antitoxin system HicB family antitoxin [Pelosinus sp. IPA-1]GMB02080.1 hypothetical protein PIPA1_48800 [Pelosinus sp. IPA-1]